MAVTTDIVQSWQRPRAVMRRHLQRGRSEPFAFSLLIVFLVLAFIAQFPAAARVTALDPVIPVSAQMLGKGLGLLATIPFFYALAAISNIALRAFGFGLSGYAARLALFWALVAISPFVLLVGLVAGMIGPGSQLMLIGLLTFAGYLFQWARAIVEASQTPSEVA